MNQVDLDSKFLFLTNFMTTSKFLDCFENEAVCVCVWCERGVKVNFSPSGYSIAPVQLTEKTTLPKYTRVAPVATNQVTKRAGLFLDPLFHQSISLTLVPIPQV